jgi:hypothetical protein
MVLMAVWLCANPLAPSPRPAIGGQGMSEQKLRYELRHGRFGAYFHDNWLSHPTYGGAMDLQQILERLNRITDAQYDALMAAAKACQFAATFRISNSNSMEVHEDSLHEIRKEAQQALAALRAAGINTGEMK